MTTSDTAPTPQPSPSPSPSPSPEEDPGIELSTLPSAPHPSQIISIGSAEDAYAFQFHEEPLNEILSQIPPGWKVSIVSVVGAFRTGKSFLLSWFLRYLHYHFPQGTPNLIPEGEKWYEQFSSLDSESGFHWRGGVERDTTGIWMWSSPFFVKRGGEDMAVILMDTQGMFDNETTMALTASIFGLSTLLSSYQIYNVDKKIQEDNLQQLALFSEYGRMAVREEGKEVVLEKDGETSSPDTTTTTTTTTTTKKKPKPFQHIEFLVRDWQNFECDGEGEMEDLENEMSEYLDTVLQERDASDLQDTREQISSCFEKVSCFMFTHPGFAVTKKKYCGSVENVDPTFLRLLDRYCSRVFNPDLIEPKKIHGNELTAAEVHTFIKTYANMFAGGASFPEAATMLEATSMANNQNATDLSLRMYKDTMDRVAGPNTNKFLKKNEFETSHRQLMTDALTNFDTAANFGSDTTIEKYRKQLLTQISECHEMYFSLNESRNPFAGLEIILIPMAVAVLAFITRKVADTTCSSWSQTCKLSSDIMAEVYTVVFFFLLIVLATKRKQLAELFDKLSNAYGAVFGGGKTMVKQD